MGGDGLRYSWWERMFSVRSRVGRFEIKLGGLEVIDRNSVSLRPCRAVVKCLLVRLTTGKGL